MLGSRCGRRDESRRGTHECVRHGRLEWGTHLLLRREMMRFRTITLGLLLGGACGLWGQENPLSAEVKRMYQGSKNNLMRAAEKVPEADYGFRPVPEVRT